VERAGELLYRAGPLQQRRVVLRAAIEEFEVGAGGVGHPFRYRRLAVPAVTEVESRQPFVGGGQHRPGVAAAAQQQAVVTVVASPVGHCPFEPLCEFPNEVRARLVDGVVARFPVALTLDMSSVKVVSQYRRRSHLVDAVDRRLRPERAPGVDVLDEVLLVESRLPIRQDRHRLNARRGGDAVASSAVVQRPRADPVGEKRDGVVVRVEDAADELPVEAGDELEPVGRVLVGTDAGRLVGVDGRPFAAVGDAEHFAPEPDTSAIGGFGGLVGRRPRVERRFDGDTVVAVAVCNLTAVDCRWHRPHVATSGVRPEHARDADHLSRRRPATASIRGGVRLRVCRRTPRR